MQSLRRHPRLLLIALLAYVAQIVLALAHVHAPTGMHRYAASCAKGAVTGREVACPKPSPVDHHRDCALCAAMHAAFTLMPAAAPAVALCFSTERLAVPRFPRDTRPSRSVCQNQPRAPPSSDRVKSSLLHA